MGDDGWVEAIKVAGAGPLSFAALGILLLAWVVSKLFSPGDGIHTRVFVFTVLVLGLGLLLVRVTPIKDVGEPLNASSPPVTPASTPISTAAPPTNPTANPTKGSIRKRTVVKTAPPMPLDELTGQSDRYYDDGKFADAYRLNVEGCRRGVGISCYWNGYLAENGKGMARNVDQAIAWYDKGCRMGEGNSCTRRAALRQ
jgi:hypothetical protein